MIDERNPDFANTPVHPSRPTFAYKPLTLVAPLVSIITPYYNTGAIFQETFNNVRAMSFQQWEWIIVDDGSTDPFSLAQLQETCAADQRIWVIHQVNSGPAVARNRAAAIATGRYLFQIDSDDLVELTYLEKCLWFLETQPQFAFCNALNIGFGAQTYLWHDGFARGVDFLDRNWVHMCALLRRQAHLDSGGYDESIRTGHEDWDYWLNLAEAGCWGYTIPEYLTWYRRQVQSRINETLANTERKKAFQEQIQTKHHRLREAFPTPLRVLSLSQPFPEISTDLSIYNPLQKPDGIRRVLFIVPWLEIGGADKFNCDLIHALGHKQYEFTVVTTLSAHNEWLSVFARYTPDIFCLDRFLNYGDYPRFLSYLIESRQIDAVLISNSELGYTLLPYLRTRYPDLAYLDYNHMEQPDWRNGGYPKRAIEVQTLLDANVVSTQHLKDWMVKHGGATEQIHVVTTNIDAEQWNPALFDRVALRRDLGIADNTPILLYIGRITSQKRPLAFAKILAQLKKATPNFICLVIGDGEELPRLKDWVRTYQLRDQIQFMGAVSSQRVCELMSVGDILVLPSANEGLALVLYEAMSMQVIPVTALVGGQIELVTPDVGYLIPPAAHALAADEAAEYAAYVAALTVLITQPEQRQAMALKGRARILERFSLARMAEAMDTLITEALQHSRQQSRSGVDIQVGQYAAVLAIELFRLKQLSDLFWNGTLPREVNGSMDGAGIQQTRVWRMVNAWWQFKNRCLPLGSRRRRFYEYVWQKIFRETR